VILLELKDKAGAGASQGALVQGRSGTTIVDLLEITESHPAVCRWSGSACFHRRRMRLMERGRWVLSGGIALGITLLLLCCAEHEATEGAAGFLNR
jgi:hypothetical protein